MAKKKQILYPVVFMVLLTALYTLVLAGINASTVDIIKAQEALRIEKSILYCFNIPFEQEDGDTAINAKFDASVIIKKYHDMTYYVYQSSDEVKGYAFQFSGKGLWGTITGYLAVSPDFSTLLGVDFISHSETPGLGGRIDEAWYKEQFRLLPLTSASPVVYRPAVGGTLDAVTGATLTSNSVRDMINSFYASISDIKQEVISNE